MPVRFQFPLHGLGDMQPPAKQALQQSHRSDSGEVSQWRGIADDAGHDSVWRNSLKAVRSSARSDSS